SAHVLHDPYRFAQPHLSRHRRPFGLVRKSTLCLKNGEGGTEVRDINPYEQDLGRNPANHQPLTPLTLFERAAKIFPDHTAIVHGGLRRSYSAFWERSVRLASALSRCGIGKGDTVSVMLSNTPPMLEAHHGVPMTKAVLHSINTRLDAATIAFQLDHAESKVVIIERVFYVVMRDALARATVKPLGIDYDDPEYPAT